MRLTWHFLWFACLLPQLAAAQVYRCEGDPPVYQDLPCDAGGRALAPTISSVGDGVRASERAWLKQRERVHRQQRKARTAAQARAAKQQREGERQQQRCWKKRRQLEDVKARLRRGYKSASGDALRRKRQGYEDYLFRYCD